MKKFILVLCMIIFCVRPSCAQTQDQAWKKHDTAWEVVTPKGYWLESWRSVSIAQIDDDYEYHLFITIGQSNCWGSTSDSGSADGPVNDCIGYNNNCALVNPMDFSSGWHNDFATAYYTHTGKKVIIANLAIPATGLSSWVDTLWADTTAPKIPTIMDSLTALGKNFVLKGFIILNGEGEAYNISIGSMTKAQFKALEYSLYDQILTAYPTAHIYSVPSIVFTGAESGCLIEREAQAELALEMDQVRCTMNTQTSDVYSYHLTQAAHEALALEMLDTIRRF